MDNGLCIALASVDVSEPLEFASQLTVVVNLPVENNPYCAILVRHGLMTTAEVHDGKAAMAKSHASASPSSALIRPSVCKSFAHRRNL
jgi:hypothetical protein